MSTLGMVRTEDPTASHEAARKVSRKRRELWIRVLKLFQTFGEMEDGKLVERYREVHGDVPESTPRKRRTELTDVSIIIDTGRHTPRHVAVVPTKAAPMARRKGHALFRVIWDLDPIYKDPRTFAKLIEGIEDGSIDVKLPHEEEE